MSLRAKGGCSVATDEEKLEDEITRALVSIYGALVAMWTPLKGTDEQNKIISDRLDNVSKALDSVLNAIREKRGRGK
jgi:hypothetical protein